MRRNTTSSQKTAIFDNNPMSRRIWVIGSFNLLLLIVMFFIEVASLQADGLFDFQMKLAIKGNPEAQFKVGEMYETGFGVKKSMKEAEIWINKAASQGHETAGFKLLYWDMKKNGKKGDNKAKYNEMVTKAESGNGQAMYYVGKAYAEGVGVRQNYDKSLDWLNKATFIGVLEAEREAVVVREQKQRALAQTRRKEEKRKAAAAAAAAEAKTARAAEAKRLEEAKRKQNKKANENKRKNEEAMAANAAAEATRKADLERKKAERAAAAAAKEKKRQALLKQRANQKKKREDAFESDPCSGKSARFLSTCR